MPKIVEIGASVGELRIVRSGLAPGSRVVIEGLMYARPGGKVTPKPGTITLPHGQGVMRGPHAFIKVPGIVTG